MTCSLIIQKFIFLRNGELEGEQGHEGIISYYVNSAGRITFLSVERKI